MPKQKVYEENIKSKRQADDTLKNKIYVEDKSREKVRTELQQDAQRKSRDDEVISKRVLQESERQSKSLVNDDKMRLVMQTNDKSLSGLVDEQKYAQEQQRIAQEQRNAQEQKQNIAAANLLEKTQRQNSI